MKTILFQIACGVRHLHSLRIVHRDLKPANILLADNRHKSKKNSRNNNNDEDNNCFNNNNNNDNKSNTTVYEIFCAGHYVAKISDMGLGKQFVGHSSYGASQRNDASFLGQSNGVSGQQTSMVGAGSVGWQAPEIMALRSTSDQSYTRSEGSNGPASDNAGSSPAVNDGNTPSSRTSRSTDIFSLGCVFYSALVPGAHPFGEWYEREANIMHNRPNLSALEALSREAHDLVSAMINRNPHMRPTAQQVCDHPYFWNKERRITFLSDFSDRIEIEATASAAAAAAAEDPLHVRHAIIPPLVLAVERNASQVVGVSWDRHLNEDLISNVQRFRTYDPASVRDLLRLIRNKHRHFDDLPPTFKERVNYSCDGLMQYFESRFPRLLIHCFNVCRDYLPVEDPISIKYACTPFGRPNRSAGNRTGDSGENAVKSTSGRVTSSGVSHVGSTVAKDETVVPVNDELAAKKDPPSSSNELAVSDCPIPEDLSVSNDKAEETQETVLRGSVHSLYDDDPSGLVILYGSNASKAFNCRGWYRPDDDWSRVGGGLDTSFRTPPTQPREHNLMRFIDDPKFRTRLCNHWDASQGTACPMRNKNKCVFAHGPVELRVKEGKRNRWGKLVDANGDNSNPNHSGGEDTYGAARSIETERKQEGKWNTNGSNGRKPGPKTKKQQPKDRKRPTGVSVNA